MPGLSRTERRCLRKVLFVLAVALAGLVLPDRGVAETQPRKGLSLAGFIPPAFSLAPRAACPAQTSPLQLSRKVEKSLKPDAASKEIPGLLHGCLPELKDVARTSQTRPNPGEIMPSGFREGLGQEALQPSEGASSDLGLSRKDEDPEIPDVGRREVQVSWVSWMGNLSVLNSGVKIKAGRVYSVIAAGYGNIYGDIWTAVSVAGFSGMVFRTDPVFIGVDVGYMYMDNKEFFRSRPSEADQHFLMARLLMSSRISRRLSLIGGGGFGYFLDRHKPFGHGDIDPLFLLGLEVGFEKSP